MAKGPNVANRAADPSTPSLANASLAPMWGMIKDILAGAKAVRAAGKTYLPKFPAESNDEYDRRKDSAPWRPEFEDAIRAISARPFTDEVKLVGEPSGDIAQLADDIDGRGNNLNTFAKDVFEGGVTLGAHGILVDFPSMQAGATIADEKAAGARPYWVSVGADEIIAMRTTKIGRREVVTHLRLKETAIETNGFEEKTVDRIRVLEPGKWEIWKPVANIAGSMEWVIESEGKLTLDEVPFVFYATAKRIGSQYVRPPLLDLADMQIELYRFLSTEEQIYTIAGSPMLTANGMSAPTDGGAVETGPGRVLYAPGFERIATSWDYIQPDAANLTAISAKAAGIIEDMRRLGLQPMLPKTGNITATASGVEAAKAHSAVGTWANGLKDALEQAWVFTAKWMKSSEAVSVSVNTDFGVGLYEADDLRVLLDSYKANVISSETYIDELIRRDLLGPQFDPEANTEQLLAAVPVDIPDIVPPGGGGPQP